MNAKEELLKCLDDEHYNRVHEILDTHDLVPIDQGEFKPEDFGFKIYGEDHRSGALLFACAGWLLEKHLPGTIRFRLLDLQGPAQISLPFWPSRPFAALLLRELGIAE